MKNLQKNIKIIFSIADLFQKSIDESEIIKNILHQSLEMFNAEAASIIIYSKIYNRLIFYSVQGESGKLLTNKSIALEEGIAGWVYQNNKSQIVNNVNKDDRFSKRFDIMSGFTTKNILCTPINYRDKKLGILEVINKLDGDFTNANLNWATILSSQIGITLENINLIQNITNEREKLDTIIKQMNDGIIVWTQEDNSITINPETQKMLKYKINPDAAFIKIKFLIDELLALDTVANFNFFNVSRNDVIFEGRYKTILNNNSEVTALIIGLRDVTAYKKEDREKSGLLSIISHKLQQSSNKIKKLVQQNKMVSKTEIIDNIEFFNNKIENEISILNERIQKLVYFNLLEAGPLRIDRSKIKLSILLTELKNIHDPIFHNKKISFEINCNNPDIFLYIDHSQIIKVFNHILQNALKFSDENTYVCVNVYVDEKNVLFTISDEGKGVDITMLPYLFDKSFYLELLKKSGDFDKIGLGLAFVKHIIDAHGGDIWAEKRKDKGTNIFFLLPIIEEK